MQPQNIRNFAIISHVDHGKSTLADRFLELTGTVDKREMRQQFLDQMDLERERGITIKMQPVRMIWRIPNHPDGLHFENQKSEIKNQKLGSDFYILNLIDTPGHVDFSYEVSRALAAVEGVILLIDGVQGIQAQTIFNFEIAKKLGLKIIPAINKIDLDIPDIEEQKQAVANLVGAERQKISLISAKTGQGVEELLGRIVAEIPPPRSGQESVSRALIFDSHYDPHRGVIAHIRVFDGKINSFESYYLMASKTSFRPVEIGYFNPGLVKAKEISSGQIGYIATGIKKPDEVRIGDTIINQKSKIKNQKQILKTKNEKGLKTIEMDKVEPLAGYKEPKPMVFASIYPVNADDYEPLDEALKRLKLNDASLQFEPESSPALGRGFRAGFLGLLHLDITQERLRREFNLDLVVTIPSVVYIVDLKNGESREIYKAQELPEVFQIKQIQEPWLRLEIFTPDKYLGPIMKLAKIHRMIYKETETLGKNLRLLFEAPMAEVIYNFYDKLKSISQGFGSMNYELIGWRPQDLQKLEILVAGERVEAFSRILPKDQIYGQARQTIKKLKELLPRENFVVALQAVVGGRVIARENIPALKKDVAGYLYGGDRTRKMKLWQKQKRGKKKLKQLGKVKIAPKVFMEMLRR